ncbi:DUF6993 domain-containing protein [Microbacterium sp. RD1]|uniref:DUF6993 domain-containing protein n=1 Tax=Microbacterium sp. RD1 TaxID=3457313 RepID=UPI003FA5FD62
MARTLVTLSGRARPWGRAAAILLVLALATGCAPSEPAPSPTTASASQTATPTPTSTEPAFMREGTAQENLPYFASVVRSVWIGPEPVAGRAYVDALAAAGFDKAAMQVTADESTVGNPAESIQFSVRWGDECLVGQVGPATGEPVATVLPGLEDGGCLIGTTRTIDW